MNNLIWLWQLPQHILALIIRKYYSSKIIDIFEYKGRRVHRIKNGNFAVSLGKYIFVDATHIQITVCHEYGHSVQSTWFGPLYLLVIGIPSAVFNNLYDRLFHKKWDSKKRNKWYYSRWPEGYNNDKKQWWWKLSADYQGKVYR
jgi:hypothetical protein